MQQCTSLVVPYFNTSHHLSIILWLSSPALASHIHFLRPHCESQVVTILSLSLLLALLAFLFHSCVCFGNTSKHLPSYKTLYLLPFTLQV